MTIRSGGNSTLGTGALLPVIYAQEMERNTGLPWRERKPSGDDEWLEGGEGGGGSGVPSPQSSATRGLRLSWAQGPPGSTCPG